VCCIQNSCPGDITRGIDKMQKSPVLNMHNSLTNGKVHVYTYKQIPVDLDTILFKIQMRCKSYMCLICIWPVYGSYMAWMVNSYNPLIWDLQGTYKSLPYIPYKPHIGETVVPGKYLFCDTMHVYNRIIAIAVELSYFK